MSLKDPNPTDPQHPRRVAIVIANPATSTTTGWPVGFWWSELTHPYLVLTEAGYAVEVFSPDGGRCEADAMSDPRDPSGYSKSDLISMSFVGAVLPLYMLLSYLLHGLSMLILETTDLGDFIIVFLSPF